MKIKVNYRRFFKIIGLTLTSFILIALISICGIYLVNPNFIKNNPQLGKIFNPIAIPDKTINVLLLGLDKVSQNTDVIVVANINPITKKINIVSIPRDTRVSYNNGKHFKVNSAYKEDLSKEKVGEIIGQPIDYQIVANPEGFRNVIDILDGIDIDVPMDMDYDDNDQDLHIHLKKGFQHLNGEKAEQFVRYRHGYKEGDLGRIDAQHIFFKAFVEQKLNPKYLLKADDVIAEIFKNVKSEMSLTDAIKYALFAKQLKTEDIKFYKLPGEAKRVGGAWYYLYNAEDTKKMVEQDFNASAVPTDNSNPNTQTTPNTNNP